MYSIEFKGITSKQVGVEVVERPSMPTAERNVEEISVPGRNGALFFDYKTYKPITINIDLNFKSEPDEWHEKLSQIKRWIRGGGMLRLSDMPGEFLNVYRTSLSECERSSKQVGTLTAEFVIEPFKYLDVGEEVIENVSGSITNPGTEAEPLYYIAGTGTATLTINGKEIKALVDNHIYIDTALQVAYKSATRQASNNIDGDYEDMKLQEGTNTITISQGFTLHVKPRWRRL